MQTSFPVYLIKSPELFFFTPDISKAGVSVHWPFQLY
jgi:hypothetical protein